MWLINAHSLGLEEVWGENVKEYAILSHRWEEEEISFKDMQSTEMAANKRGFSKITKSCELALRDGYDYIWVDTCCINKESSAEISEAINSMYRWYKAAATCYAYLSDVDCDAASNISVESQFQQSLWFTRGWTLQELLAPDKVIFYDFKWAFLGTKHTMSGFIKHQTGIDDLALHGKSLADYSIAQRMSWASQRTTTRVEDIAYSLLGIFDVNMPMLYGEGTKAFLRLQEEIIKQSDDHSIFAWSSDDRQQTGLLADSPAAFASCQDVKAVVSRTNQSSYAMTNRGLSCTFVAIPFIVDTYLVRLNCTNVHNLDLGIFLNKLRDDDQYARVWCHGRSLMGAKAGTWDGTQIKVNVRQRQPDLPRSIDRMLHNGFRIIPYDNPANLRFTVHGCEWNPLELRMSFRPGNHNQAGVLDLRSHGGKIAYMKLGFDVGYNPVCFVLANRLITGEIDGTSINFGSPDVGSKQAKSFGERTPFGNHDWSRLDRDGYAHELDGLPGLWALKGDRLDGLNAWLISDSISAFVGPHSAYIRIARNETLVTGIYDESVWDESVWDVLWTYSEVSETMPPRAP